MKKRLGTDSILRERKRFNGRRTLDVSYGGRVNFFLKMSQRYYELTHAFWACLAYPIKNNIIILHETFMFISMQTINFITQFFFEILQR